MTIPAEKLRDTLERDERNKKKIRQIEENISSYETAFEQFQTYVREGYSGLPPNPIDLFDVDEDPPQTHEDLMSFYTQEVPMKIAKLKEKKAHHEGLVAVIEGEIRHWSNLIDSLPDTLDAFDKHPY